MAEAQEEGERDWAALPLHAIQVRLAVRDHHDAFASNKQFVCNVSWAARSPSSRVT